MIPANCEKIISCFVAAGTLEMGPQTDPPAIDEFLKLERCLSASMASPNRTKHARRGAGGVAAPKLVGFSRKPKKTYDFT